jgi:hypothetical protein
LVLTAALLAHAAPALAQTFDHDHTAWNRVLTSHVVNDGAISTVDYAAIEADPSGSEHYAGLVTRVTPAQFDAWSAPQRLAFLINAYNALTVTLIINNYPVASIKDLGGAVVTVEEAFLQPAGQRASPRRHRTRDDQKTVR